MIMYNVTVNVDEDCHLDWLDWMKKVHLPMVMATGKFLSYSMYQIMDRQEDETGVTYSIQYLSPDLASYESYRDEHAPGLQADTQKHWGGKFAAFRTLLKLDHSYEKI